MLVGCSSSKVPWGPSVGMEMAQTGGGGEFEASESEN